MPLQFKIAVSFFSLEFHTAVVVTSSSLPIHYTSTTGNLAYEQAEGSVLGFKGRE